MHRSKIEWVLNPDNKTLGWVWNPITGCLNNCPYCYARKLANGRLKSRYLANDNYAPPIEACKALGGQPVGQPLLNPFYPRFWPDRLFEPTTVITWSQRRRWGPQAQEKGIFVCDMGELFGDWLPKQWQEEIFLTIKSNPQHRFYLLTKQPQNLTKWSPFPKNCWVGITATDADTLYSAMNYLDDIQCSLRYISLEPLLSNPHLADLDAHFAGSVDWVIIGAQTPSSPKTAPQIEWVREIVDACDKAGVAVFLKNNLGCPDTAMKGHYPFIRGTHQDLWCCGKSYPFKLLSEEFLYGKDNC